MISNHKDDIHPRGLLQTGRQKRVQAQEQPTNAQIAGLPKIDVPWKAGSSGSALSLGASVGAGALVGGPIGAVLGAGAFIVSKMFSKDKPTGIPQKVVNAWLDKVSSVLKTYSPEDRQKILASNDPVIKQYIAIRDGQEQRIMTVKHGISPTQEGFTEQVAKNAGSIQGISPTQEGYMAALTGSLGGVPVRGQYGELLQPWNEGYGEYAKLELQRRQEAATGAQLAARWV